MIITIIIITEQDWEIIMFIVINIIDMIIIIVVMMVITIGAGLGEVMGCGGWEAFAGCPPDIEAWKEAL